MEYLNALPPTYKAVILVVVILLIIATLTIGKRREP